MRFKIGSLSRTLSVEATQNAPMHPWETKVTLVAFGAGNFNRSRSFFSVITATCESVEKYRVALRPVYMTVMVT